MNNKLLFQDLSDQLSEVGKLKKKEAEEFLKLFFKVIEESLFQGEVVKIQGLGTFRLLQVDSRKSVNVSTGEEFEIKEHYKISFVPDLALKGVVNEPFSHLEPVELTNTSEKAKPIEQKVSTEIIKPEKSTIITPESMPQNKNDLKSPNKSIKNDLKQPIPKPRINPEKSAEKTVLRRRSYSGVIFWVLFVLIAGSLVIWALKSNQDANKENQQRMKDAAQFDTTAFVDAKPEELATVIEDSLKLEAEIAAKVESLARVEKTPKSSKSALVQNQAAKPVVKAMAEQPVKSNVKQYNAGISNISFPVFETLDKGEMLTLMALKYYGHKAFWVYIYAANLNTITDPNHIPLGTKIRIPKPDPSRINANDPNCIAKAKALQTKILSR